MDYFEAAAWAFLGLVVLAVVAIVLDAFLCLRSDSWRDLDDME